jgi:hypothetical protein
MLALNRSFENGVDTNKCSEGLGFDLFDVQPQSNLCIKFTRFTKAICRPFSESWASTGLHR